MFNLQSISILDFAAPQIKMHNVWHLISGEDPHIFITKG